MTDQETFTTRLRRQRQRTRVPLSEIAATTRVKEALLEGLERNDLSAWPRGLYARAYMRSYATAIGLEPEYTVEEFCRLFPHGDRRVHLTMKQIAGIIASESEWKDEFKNADGERRQAARPQPGTLEALVMQVTFIIRSWRTWGADLATMGTRLVAFVPKAQSRKPKAGF